CSGGEQHEHYSDDASGQCRGGDGDGDQSWATEREFDQWVYVCGGPDGEQCVTQQWSNDGWNECHDHGGELWCGSDGELRRHGSDERGGGQQHQHHGDHAGACGGCGRGNGDGQWAKWELDEWVHIQRHGGDWFRSGSSSNTTELDGDGIG